MAIDNNYFPPILNMEYMAKLESGDERDCVPSSAAECQVTRTRLLLLARRGHSVVSLAE